MAEAEDVWLSRDEWYASQPPVLVSAGALITDDDDRVLLVKPNYRSTWGVPGGMRDDGEAPHQTCRREVAEEVGLDIAVGPLLVVLWAPKADDQPLPVMHLLYDGGSVHDPAIRLQEDELDDYAFVPPEEGAGLLGPLTGPRLPAALAARAGGRTAYLPL